jgi:hypothetical protein
VTERGHVNHLDITVQRTWCGKTRARITGRADGAVIDVTVTGWRRASVVDEARRTFTATAVLQLPKGHPMIRALLISVALLVGLPAAAGAPGHHEFNDTAVLDASQVVDGRGLYGELVCQPGDNVPDDCEIDYHPADES